MGLLINGKDVLNGEVNAEVIAYNDAIVIRMSHMKLTDAQERLMGMMRKKGTNLIRARGGRWTFRDVPTKRVMDYMGVQVYDRYAIPVWFTSKQVIRVLEAKGLIKRAHVYPEEWRDERCLA